MKKGLLKMVATLICTMTCALGLVACRDNTTKTSESNEVQIRQTYQEIYGKMSDLLMDTAISSMTPVSKLSIRKCNNTVLYATSLWQKMKFIRRR